MQASQPFYPTFNGQKTFGSPEFSGKQFDATHPVMPTIESKPFLLNIKETETASCAHTKCSHMSSDQGEAEYSSGLSDFEEDNSSPKNSVLLKKAQSHLSRATDDNQ